MINQFKGDPGYFNKGLGCYVNNSKEADKIADSRGLVREEDLGKHYTADRAYAEKTKHEATVKKDAEFKENLAKNTDDDAGRAQAAIDTWSGADIIADKYDDSE